MDLENIDWSKYLPSPDQEREDEEHKSRVRLGSGLLSLLNTPSAAELSASREIDKPDYIAQGESTIKSMPDRLGQAGKIASVLSAYRAQKNDSPQAKAELFRLQEKIRLANDTSLEGIKHKNTLEILDKKKKSGMRDIVDPETGMVTTVPNEGKVIPSTAVDSLSRADAALKQLDALEDAVKNKGAAFGPFMGKIKAANPYDEEGQAIDSLFNSGAQDIGTYLEGGKLTDVDFPKYKKMVGGLGNTPETAINKIQIMRQKVLQKRQAELDTLSKAGYASQGIGRKEVSDSPQVLKPAAVAAPLAERKPIDQKITVSNGKETLKIPASRLKEAEADGFKAVP